MMNTAAKAVRADDQTDRELETILTSFDTNYAWNYGNVKEGLRDLYEKAKRDQWNGTTQLAWNTDVDPERDILPGDDQPAARTTRPYRTPEREGEGRASATRRSRCSCRSSCTASRAR